MNARSPHWILQKNLTNVKVFDTIKATLNADGASFEEVQVIPFSDEVPLIASMDRPLIFYGSTTLILNAARDSRYRDGVFFDPTTFCMANYLHHWGDRMLNADGRITSFATFSMEMHAPETQFFIRPDADSKSFSGQVMKFAAIQAFSAQLLDCENPHLSPRTPILISAPKSITKEWRSFVVGGKQISTTRYLVNGEIQIDPSDLPFDLCAFLDECIAVYQPHAVFVIDVALSKGRFAILECNCWNGTGFYGHDIPAVVRAVHAWRQASFA